MGSWPDQALSRQQEVRGLNTHIPHIQRVVTKSEQILTNLDSLSSHIYIGYPGRLFGNLNHALKL